MLRFVALFAIGLCSVQLLVAQTVITGTVTGADGKPMPKAHVHLTESQYAEKPLHTVEAGNDGHYRITLEKPLPVFLVQYTGAFHKMQSVPLLLPKADKLTVNVQLQPNACEGAIEGVQAIGDFNGFDFQAGIPLQKQPDGTYAADVKAQGEKTSYQLLINDGHSLAMRSVNGTMYDALEYDGGGDYRSVVKAKNGMVRLVFDPKKFPQKPATATVVFGKESKQYETFSKLAEEASARMSNIQMMSATAESDEARIEIGNSVKEMIKDMEQQIAGEKDAKVRQYRLLFYLDLVAMTRPSKEKENPTLERAFNEIAPNSPLWVYKPHLVFTSGALQDEQKAKDYRKKVLETNSNGNVRCTMLSYIVSDAFYNNRKEEGEKYYAALMKEFPDSQEADNAKKQFAPNRAIQEGKAVPDFSFTALDNDKEVYTRASMKGKYYLIDFWATWCGPCVGEMKNLHNAYEKFKDKNFAIISLSFDGSPDDVTKFRGKKWTMPWLHSFIDGGFRSDAAKAFEVAGIPKPILVGPDGQILATAEALRGEKLEETLTKYLVEAR